MYAKYVYNKRHGSCFPGQLSYILNFKKNDVQNLASKQTTQRGTTVFRLIFKFAPDVEAATIELQL